jgi:hypothetical protein
MVAEVPFQLWPLHFERKYFLSADVSGEQRRVIRREPKPIADHSCSPTPHLADIRDGFNLVVARPKPDNAVALVRMRELFKIDVLSVMRPHRKSYVAVARFCPTLRGGVEEHQVLRLDVRARNVSAVRRPVRRKESR